MIGWMGFNAGLGGAALAALAGGQSQALASAAILVAASLLALAGLRWWNWFALAATAASLALIVIVIASVDPTGVPVTAALPAPARLL